MNKMAKMKQKILTERVVNVAKDVFSWMIVTALSFVYWLVVLLIFSLILLNVWNTSFEEILHYSMILMVITSIVYLIRILRRRFRANV